ncbi:hypothetical protein BDR07DRAFT_1438847 [Suillus spraguei]|nr:hypothetical protein BDR07DRAFT_1438847 [Suillus spraguei]
MLVSIDPEDSHRLGRGKTFMVNPLMLIVGSSATAYEQGRIVHCILALLADIVTLLLVLSFLLLGTIQ